MNKLILILFSIIILNSCSHKITGTLTDADTYFSVDVKSDSHDYATFISLQTNLPAGISNSKGKYMYLNIEPKLLAKYASEELRIKGKKIPNSNFINPQKIWLKQSGKWILIYPTPPYIN